MCALCRKLGRNIYDDQPEIMHMIDDDDAEFMDLTDQVWYVWRRSDGCVMSTNMHPDEAFHDGFTYHVLLVTSDMVDVNEAIHMARTIN